jgi:tetraacyldisaccharide 4'-kinase
MKAPGFWYGGAGSPVGAVLSPLGWVYGAATALRQRLARPESAGAPVICIGNLTAGGAGKTPVVLDLAGRLAAAGMAPHVISRGYGGTAGPDAHRVDPARDDAASVGDEPLMMARTALVWVGAERAATARAAVADGAGVLVLDDGFQDPSLQKDLSLVVVDGRFGFGNGFLIPAGPLRESIGAGLARADGVVIVGDDAWGVEDAVRRFGPQGLAVLRARIVPGPEAAAIAGRPVLAFAGIGHPDKFFQTLRDQGCELAETRAFADHHPYTAAELEGLRRRAGALNARLVTTEKDAQRLPGGAAPDIGVLTITLQWDDEAALDRLLHSVKS